MVEPAGSNKLILIVEITVLCAISTYHVDFNRLYS